MPMRSSQSLKTRRLRLSATDDASLAAILNGFQVGPTSAANLIADQNEIMARNNGAVSTLHFQADGGVLLGRGNTAELAVLAPYRQGFLRVGADVAITNTLADVAAMTSTFTTEVANAQLLVTLNARFVKTSGGVPATQIVAAYLVVDGTIMNSAHMTLTNPLYDDVRSCSWVGKLASVGSHTVKTQIVRTGTTETIVLAAAVGTGLTLEVWG